MILLWEGKRSTLLLQVNVMCVILFSSQLQLTQYPTFASSQTGYSVCGYENMVYKGLFTSQKNASPPKKNNTRIYSLNACLIKNCSKLGVHLITECFRATEYNFSKFPLNNKFNKLQMLRKATRLLFMATASVTIFNLKFRSCYCPCVTFLLLFVMCDFFTFVWRMKAQ